MARVPRASDLTALITLVRILSAAFSAQKIGKNWRQCHKNLYRDSKLRGHLRPFKDEFFIIVDFNIFILQNCNN